MYLASWRYAGSSSPLRTWTRHSSPLAILPERARRFISTSRSDDHDTRRFGDFVPVLSESPYSVGISHIPRKTFIPDHIVLPSYARHPHGKPEPSARNSILELATPEELAMRRTARLARQALALGARLARPGVTTEHIDDVIHEFILSSKAYPSPLGYQGYPKSCCTSVNNVLIHGIPDSRPLEDGDIINIDVTVFLDGFHGDCSETFPVGDVDMQGLHIISASREALAAGISACGPGRPFKAIGNAISSVAKRMGCSVSSEAFGHGIGRDLHCPPWILHHLNEEPGTMMPGHCFTIEPALVQGDDARSWMLPDGWTVLTETGARSAQMEHTILITESGFDVLTSKSYKGT